MREEAVAVCAQNIWHHERRWFPLWLSPPLLRPLGFELLVNHVSGRPCVFPLSGLFSFGLQAFGIDDLRSGDVSHDQVSFQSLPLQVCL